MASRKNDKHRKKWFDITISGALWTIYLVEPEPFAEYMTYREGVCIFGLSSILIDRNLSAERKKDTVFHEIGHAVNYAASIEGVVFTGMSRKEIDKREEQLVCLQSPVMYAALTQRKLLKLPRIPKGW